MPKATVCVLAGEVAVTLPHCWQKTVSPAAAVEAMKRCLHLFWTSGFFPFVQNTLN